MDKRGQIFELLLFLMAVAMCGIVIMLFFVEQQNASNSLVSPRGVLEVRDGLAGFETMENKIILESLKEIGGESFGSESYADNFRDVFLKKLKSNDEMKEFIFSNLARETEARAQGDAFLSSIYSVKLNDGKIILERAKIEKRIFLRAEESNIKINFPVDFVFEFEGEYLISYEDNKFKVERV